MPVVPEMRVRSFFIACMSVAAVIALIVAGKLVLMSWSAYTAQAAASEAVGMAAKLMKISEGLANERGPYSVAVAADQPAGDKDRELFRGLRADTDRALAAAGEAAKQAALVGAHDRPTALSPVMSTSHGWVGVCATMPVVAAPSISARSRPARRCRR